MRDKSKIVSVLVGKLAGGKPKEESSMDSEGDDMDYGDGLSSAASSLLRAIKKDDASAVASALKSFVSMCSHEEDDDEE